jgi:glycosyltransferase involved in cell wall biosynthesis
MKVAVIAPTYIPSIRANSLQVMKMTQAIAILGIDVRLLVPEDSGDSQINDRSWRFLSNHYGIDNPFSIEWLPSRPGLRKYDYAWYAVNRAQKWNADVIYTRLPQAAGLASLRNLSTILEVHDFPQGTMGPILFQLFINGKGSRRLIVISKVLAADLRTKFGSPVVPPFTLILPDGVDLDRYRELPKPSESRRQLEQSHENLVGKVDPEIFSVGYSGHLYLGRGISLILEMAQRLPEMNFLLVGGDPSDVNQLKRILVNRHLHNVILTGFIPNADLPRYQSACDVLLMPYQRQVSASSGGDISRYLSPMKLFEYMACGRAICSSDLPVFNEVLSPEIAILLPPDEVNAWVAALQKLADRPQLRNKLASNARVAAEDFTWDNRAKQIFVGI